MNFKTLVFIAIILVINIGHGFTQRAFRFSVDGNLFHEELTTFMGPNLSKEDKEFLIAFAGVWESSYFTENYRLEIIDIANQFAGLRARPIPHFINFLHLLNKAYKNKIGENEFNSILNGLKFLPAQQNFNLTLLNAFLLRLNHFISDNIIFSSNSVEWKIAGGEYFIRSYEKFEIVFSKVNLIGKTRNDSLVIWKTNGSYFPAEALWLGEKGTVNWVKAGLDENKVYAILSNYEINLTRIDYRADSVLFKNYQYFREPLLGTLIDRISSLKNPANSDFPRFESYGQDFKIDNIYPGFFYRGGFSMQGSRLIGLGSKNANARLFIHNHDSLLLTVTSQSFVFLPHRAYSTNASLLIHLGNDSIYHPELSLNFTTGSREVSFFRSGKGMSHSPYINSYHNLDMTFEQLKWRMGDSIMYFTMPRASSIGIAKFESINFFNRNIFEAMQGMDMQHPLILVRNFKNYFYAENLPVVEFANFARKSVSEIRHVLLDLALKGYILL